MTAKSQLRQLSHLINSARPPECSISSISSTVESGRTETRQEFGRLQVSTAKPHPFCGEYAMIGQATPPPRYVAVRCDVVLFLGGYVPLQAVAAAPSHAIHRHLRARIVALRCTASDTYLHSDTYTKSEVFAKAFASQGSRVHVSPAACPLGVNKISSVLPVFVFFVGRGLRLFSLPLSSLPLFR
jgi:hypothetical protein